MSPLGCAVECNHLGMDTSFFVVAKINWVSIKVTIGNLRSEFQ